MLLREAFYGVQRFEVFQQHLGIARNILSARLEHLVIQGVFEHIPYQEPGQRTRYEYRLSAKGRDLLPALIALSQWGDQYHPHPEGRPMVLHHRETGQEVGVRLVRKDGTPIQKMRDLEPVFWPDKKDP